MLYATMQDMVGSFNASAFVGRDLGTDQKWPRAVDPIYVLHGPQLFFFAMFSDLGVLPSLMTVNRPIMLAYPAIVLSTLPPLARALVKTLLFAPLLWVQRTMNRCCSPSLPPISKSTRPVQDEMRFTASWL
ncbi:hypothetical protein GGR56DRAFT_660791 [Xylariaceae sp. FL0804]|nr:hypothetical protein GGR56DRAFT_660791 [Xylariaceae sp. FL0804]